MKLSTKSVAEYGLSESLAVMNLGFSDYIVPIQLDLARFSGMICADDIDLSLSQIVFKEEIPVGIALIARRGWSSRLAGMAIIPEARSQGIGRWLMTQLISASKDRGDQRMELEVIAQNEPAVKLYENLGFRKMRKLLSFTLDQPQGEAGEIEEIDLRELADLVNLHGNPNLPWQLSGENLAVAGPPFRAFQLDAAYAAITNPEVEQIVLRSILVMPDERGWGQGTRLFRALFDKYRGKRWIIPAIFPEEMAGFFEKSGFERQKLSQLQMELEYERV